MNHFNPDEIRDAFNVHYRNHGGPEWVRLNLSTGPVLARRNVSHHSSPIYIAVVNNGIAQHYMVTMKRQLKSNGSASITPALALAWKTYIGMTPNEYIEAKAKKLDNEQTALYERGPRLAA